MNTELKLHSLTALFNTPDEIIHAAEKISSEGFTKYDVHTPYPVHGMDKAMKLKSSKLGYITLIFGLSGAAFALLLMYWTMSVDYPMIIGGKPFFSLPAFIPVTFELTVLLATLSTIIGMLTFFFKFPDNNNPLIDSDYMKAVSSDKYGICIYANDPKFEKDKILALFESLHPAKTSEVYFPEKTRYPSLEPKFLVMLLVVAILTSGVTYITLNKLLYIVPFDWMLKQARVNAQSKSDYFPDQFGMRKPVEGSIARGFMPYEYKDQLQQPEKPLTNPLLPTKKVLELGKSKFLTFCSPCHGNYAEGDSRLNGQFPNPPTLHSNKVREWKDGNIYHVITNGQNIMPSYASQISREERWAIIKYIRVLQRAKNASDSDIILSKKESALNGTK